MFIRSLGLDIVPDKGVDGVMILDNEVGKKVKIATKTSTTKSAVQKHSSKKEAGKAFADISAQLKPDVGGMLSEQDVANKLAQLQAPAAPATISGSGDFMAMCLLSYRF